MLGKEAFAAENLDEHAGFVLELHDLAALFVVEIGGDLVIDAHADAGDFWLLAGQGEHADDFDRHAFRRLHHAAATAAGTVAIDAALEAGADSLPGHFDQAKGACAEDLGAGPVAAHRVAEG